MTAATASESSAPAATPGTSTLRTPRITSLEDIFAELRTIGGAMRFTSGAVIREEKIIGDKSQLVLDWDFNVCKPGLFKHYEKSSVSVILTEHYLGNLKFAELVHKLEKGCLTSKENEQLNTNFAAELFESVIVTKLHSALPVKNCSLPPMHLSSSAEVTLHLVNSTAGFSVVPGSGTDTSRVNFKSLHLEGKSDLYVKAPGSTFTKLIAGEDSTISGEIDNASIGSASRVASRLTELGMKGLLVSQKGLDEVIKLEKTDAKQIFKGARIRFSQCDAFMKDASRVLTVDENRKDIKTINLLRYPLMNERLTSSLSSFQLSDENAKMVVAAAAKIIEEKGIKNIDAHTFTTAPYALVTEYNAPSSGDFKTADVVFMTGNAEKPLFIGSIAEKAIAEKDTTNSKCWRALKGKEDSAAKDMFMLWDDPFIEFYPNLFTLIYRRKLMRELKVAQFTSIIPHREIDPPAIPLVTPKAAERDVARVEAAEPEVSPRPRPNQAIVPDSEDSGLGIV